LIEARRRPYEAGEESMIGTAGTVREPLNPSGLVFTNGALWQATSTSGPLPVGTRVRVVAVDGLHLKVEKEQSKSDGSLTVLPPTVEGRQAASS
jgi:membrane-bound serine protease (ClpP class)